MKFRARRTIAIAAIVLIALPSLSAGESRRRVKKHEQPAAPVATPADKRDRVVTASGSAFHGKAYWQAAAQCGGVYFKLGTLYSESAIRAKVIKPDPAAYTAFTKEADGAAMTATAFFVMAERFLVADRKLTRDEAVIIYDPTASASGDRVKSTETAVQAAKTCPELYKACRGVFPQVCNDTSALTN